MASWVDIEEIERLSHFRDKTMFVIFVNGTGDYKIFILPGGQRVNGTFVRGVCASASGGILLSRWGEFFHERSISAIMTAVKSAIVR
jgi:hypothetical protein